METRPFGWTGVQLPVIGQGTWHMGETSATRARDVAALRLGIELGMTHIDTAEMYRGAEEVVGEAIHGVRRSDLFIVSKVLPSNGSYRGTISAAERSLRKLQTDYLDLYLLHWPGSRPIAETMRAMEDLVQAGKTRFIGVSNFEVAEMQAAMAALSRERLACNQVLYRLPLRGVEWDLIPFCAREQIAVVGYTPFGYGPAGKRGDLKVLKEIGARLGKTAYQVVLRFLTRSPGIFAIPKASRPEHVRENAAAADIELTEEDIAAVDRAFPPPRKKEPLRIW
jgi:diketogulonate reductase-like aldo/keto reductase